MKTDNIAVLKNCEKAKLLADELGLPAVEDEGEYELILKYCDDVLSLNYKEMNLFGDFSVTAKRLKKSNLRNEAPIKACRMKGRTDFRVLDATAGLGEDSFLLAAAGFSVDMYEYNPIIAKLLENALQRAEKDGFAGIVSRMTLHCEDSIEAMKKLSCPPDIIFLDPMFPERQKNSLIKKKFQVLWNIERPCANEEELLDAAISANPRRIVIKRPSKAPFLAGRKPSYTIDGSTIRYDCIVLS